MKYSLLILAIGASANIQVSQAGEYEIALRRWPREVDLELGARSGQDSRALPISAAKVSVAGQEISAKTAPTQKEVVLRAPIPTARTRLQAWFQDAVGQNLCGSFYACVKRVW